MDCSEARPWLHGYLDGELDLARTMEIERHLEECAKCSQARDNHSAMHDAIQTADLKYTCPARLRAGIENAILREVGLPRTRPKAHPWWLAIAASIVLATGFFWFAQRSGSTNDRVAQEVLASHVRSLLVDHLTDVASSDRHTVKPWFAGKLDFSPAVVDYSSAGFPLTGGRVDYLEHQPVAALVYYRRKHAINLFTWPTTNDGDSAPQFTTSQGYQIFHWTEAGSTYWAISDLNQKELDQFVQLILAGGAVRQQER